MRKEGGVRPVDSGAGCCAGGPSDCRLSNRLVGPVLMSGKKWESCRNSIGILYGTLYTLKSTLYDVSVHNYL